MRLLNRSIFYCMTISLTLLLSSCEDRPHIDDVIVEAEGNEAEADEQGSELEDDLLKGIEGELDTRAYLSNKDYVAGIKGAYERLTFPYTLLDSNDYKGIVGGIIPHHATAYVMMADFYQMVSVYHQQVPYDLIIVISPNHQSVGPSVQVVNRDYYTYEGPLHSDMETALSLAEAGATELSYADMITNEHGQLVHMSYIKHFLPDTMVLSIVITETGDDGTIYGVVDDLVPLIEDENVLVIGSIDFSHYLSLEEAEKNDAFTELLIENNDTTGMLRLTDEYIDSPMSYLMLVELLKTMGEVKPTITNHLNSAHILNEPGLRETTSYFQVVYE